MRELNFLEQLHTSTHRDHLERVTPEKPHCCYVAKLFGEEYWDGDRKYGYGGMKYDGRWKPIAEAMIKYYKLQPGDKILDIGCGKGFLMYELSLLGMYMEGIEISDYARKNPKPEMARCIFSGNASQLPWQDKSFDFAYSINVFHNLGYSDLKKALAELERVGKQKWFCVESYRTEEEKCNMLNWQLTCQSFHSPEDWKAIAQDAGYTGDIGFIYFR